MGNGDGGRGRDAGRAARAFAPGARIAVCVEPSLGGYPGDIVKSCLPGSRIATMAPDGLRSLLARGAGGVGSAGGSGRADGAGPRGMVDLAVVMDKGKWPLDDPRMDVDPLPEGAFTVSTTDRGGLPFIRVTGGGVAGVVYGAREAFGKLAAVSADGGFTLPEIAMSDAPGLPYRFMWTWDHSTNWQLGQYGRQDIGALNYYLKPKAGFLEDYRRLVDFMSENRISAVTVYGFLRDNHGGIEAAKELCSYAAARGVRIMPGVGINAYGGVYWEGDSRYNLSDWLRRNPHLRAKLGARAAFHIPDLPELWFPDNQYTDAACPSKPENATFHEEAIAWLAETFEIGGINFETGDYGTCRCDECNSRRKEDSTWSFGDMALLYPRLFEAAKKSGRDLHLVVEAYWDTILDLDAIAPLASLPDEGIYQFCVNKSYLPRLSRELTREHVAKLPRSRNIFRTHIGSQWNGQRHALVAGSFAEMASLAYRTGMQGMTVFGEASAFDPANEINYLAFARFGWNPGLAWGDFVRDDLAPRFGGAAEAAKALELLETANDADSLARAIGEAREISRTAAGDAYRRWVHIQDGLFAKMRMLEG